MENSRLGGSSKKTFPLNKKAGCAVRKRRITEVLLYYLKIQQPERISPYYGHISGARLSSLLRVWLCLIVFFRQTSEISSAEEVTLASSIGIVWRKIWRRHLYNHHCAVLPRDYRTLLSFPFMKGFRSGGICPYKLSRGRLVLIRRPLTADIAGEHCYLLIQ